MTREEIQTELDNIIDEIKSYQKRIDFNEEEIKYATNEHKNFLIKFKTTESLIKNQRTSNVVVLSEFEFHVNQLHEISDKIVQMKVAIAKLGAMKQSFSKAMGELQERGRYLQGLLDKKADILLFPRKKRKNEEYPTED